MWSNVLSVHKILQVLCLNWIIRIDCTNYFVHREMNLKNRTAHFFIIYTVNPIVLYWIKKRCEREREICLFYSLWCRNSACNSQHNVTIDWYFHSVNIVTYTLASIKIDTCMFHHSNNFPYIFIPKSPYFTLAFSDVTLTNPYFYSFLWNKNIPIQKWRESFSPSLVNPDNQAIKGLFTPFMRKILEILNKLAP